MESQTTTGNNILTTGEYDAARSHAMVLHYIYYQLNIPGEETTDLLNFISGHLAAGRPVSRDETLRLSDDVMEILAKIAERPCSKHFGLEASRVAAALHSLLPTVGESNDR